MMYQRLFDLKFKENLPTHELEKKFPREQRKISRIALLEIPFPKLKKLIKRKGEIERLRNLKRTLLKKEAQKE